MAGRVSSDGSPASPADESLADVLVEALGTFDAGALAPLLAPGMRHWVNLTRREQGAAALLAQLETEASVMSAARVEERSRTRTEDGFVLQLMVTGTTEGGTHVEIPVCLVVATDGTQVTRIDEYASLHDAEPIVREMAAARSRPSG